MIIYLKIILKSSSILAFRREGQQIHNTEDSFDQTDKTLPYQTTRNVLSKSCSQKRLNTHR